MDKENNSANPSPFINLKVKDQEDNVLFFRIKRETPLKKLMYAYCNEKSVAPLTFRFLFDGHRIKAELTPAELEMEDEDEIDAMLEMDGGHGS